MVSIHIGVTKMKSLKDVNDENTKISTDVDKMKKWLDDNWLGTARALQEATVLEKWLTDNEYVLSEGNNRISETTLCSIYEKNDRFYRFTVSPIYTWHYEKMGLMECIQSRTIKGFGLTSEFKQRMAYYDGDCKLEHKEWTVDISCRIKKFDLSNRWNVSLPLSRFIDEMGSKGKLYDLTLLENSKIRIREKDILPRIRKNKDGILREVLHKDVDLIKEYDTTIFNSKEGLEEFIRIQTIENNKLPLNKRFYKADPVTRCGYLCILTVLRSTLELGPLAPVKTDEINSLLLEISRMEVIQNIFNHDTVSSSEVFKSNLMDFENRGFEAAIFTEGETCSNLINLGK